MLNLKRFSMIVRHNGLLPSEDMKKGQLQYTTGMLWLFFDSLDTISDESKNLRGMGTVRKKR